jgi:hypothetical protein
LGEVGGVQKLSVSSSAVLSVESLIGKVQPDGISVCVGLRIGVELAGNGPSEGTEQVFRWSDGCSAASLRRSGLADDGVEAMATTTATNSRPTMTAATARRRDDAHRRPFPAGGFSASQAAVSPYQGVYGSPLGPAPASVNGYSFAGCANTTSSKNMVVVQCTYLWNSCRASQEAEGLYPCHRWRAVAEAISYQNSTTMAVVSRVYRGYEVVAAPASASTSTSTSTGVCETDIWTWKDPVGSLPNSFDTETGYRLDVSLDSVVYEPARTCLCTTAMVIFANTTTTNVTVVTPAAPGVNGTSNATSTTSFVTTTTTENVPIFPRTTKVCSTPNCPTVTRKALVELPLPKRKDKLGLGGKIGALLGCGAIALLAGTFAAWLFLKKIGGPVTIKVEGMTLPDLAQRHPT